MRNLRIYFSRLIAALIAVSVATVTLSQSQKEAAPQSPSNGDGGKYAIIINGASGEPAYAKQFQQWTASLRTALSGPYGFAADRIKVLTEKPANAAERTATAEEVRKVFTALRTEVNADSVLFVFLIGHGSFDKEAKFNLVGPDLSARD